MIVRCALYMSALLFLHKVVNTFTYSNGLSSFHLLFSSDRLPNDPALLQIIFH